MDVAIKKAWSTEGDTRKWEVYLFIDKGERIKFRITTWIAAHWLYRGNTCKNIVSDDILVTSPVEFLDWLDIQIETI